MRVHYPDRSGIWRCLFCGGRKTGEPGEKHSEQDENQQQTQPTYGTGPESNPGHIGGRRALSPLRRPCSPEQADVWHYMSGRFVEYSHPLSLFLFLGWSPEKWPDSKHKRTSVRLDGKTKVCWNISKSYERTSLDSKCTYCFCLQNPKLCMVVSTS